MAETKRASSDGQETGRKPDHPSKAGPDKGEQGEPSTRELEHGEASSSEMQEAGMGEDEAPSTKPVTE